MRKAASTAGLLLFGVAFAFGLVEAGLRLSGYKRQFARPHPSVGYVLTPGFERSVPITDPPAHTVTLRTNNLGLRRDKDSKGRLPGRRRILLLGDSQTEGIVDNADSFAARLERDAVAVPLEVLNAAVSGYSPLLSLQWWRAAGHALAPDLVLLAVYTGNDLAELLMRFEDFGGFGPTFRIPWLEASPHGFLLRLPGADEGPVGRTSYVLASWFEAYRLILRVLPRKSPPSTPELEAVARQCPGCLQSLWQAWMSQRQTGAREDALRKLSWVLEALAGEVRSTGSELVVLQIPTRLQVEPDLVLDRVRRAQEILGLEPGEALFDNEVHRAIGAVAEALGLTTIDLLPALRSAHEERGRALYWDQDWHLNPAGHAVVARELGPPIEHLAVSR